MTRSTRPTKAFLLGAGLGTRLRPLTDVLPKPLIPVFGTPLIEHTIEHCLAAGLHDFAINTHHLPDKWDHLFGHQTAVGDPAEEVPESPAFDAEYAISHFAELAITFFHEPVLLETGGGIKNIEEWIAGEPVLIYNGDILAELDLDKLLATHQASQNIVTLGLRSEGPARHIAADGPQVVDIHHKLGVAEGTHQFTGVYCVDPGLLERIPPNQKISVIPAFLELAREGKLGACLLDEGYWLDLGTREAYLAAHRPDSPLAPIPEDWIDPKARIDPTARVIESAVGAGCQIGAGAVVRSSVLWPNSRVAPGAQLTNCIVYSSTPAAGTHHQADL